jgi:aryl-alcohol dehydrogenase-like predicted oxidoreductase
VGFTGHKDPGIHLKMLSYNFPFDTVQMPLNCFDATYRSFEERVLPELNQRGIAPLGMKSFGGCGEILSSGVVTPEEALRYAMSLQVAVTISGVETLEVLHQNLAVARGFQPLATSAMQELRERCREYAADGHLELFKTTVKYDGPIGGAQHGFPTEPHDH